MKRTNKKTVLVAVISLVIFACNNNDNSSSPAETTTYISEPREVEMYLSTGTDSVSLVRPYFEIAKIGDIETQGIFGTLDTGSSITLVNGLKFLPENICNANGIFFSGDQMEYNGITLTKKTGVAGYGGTGGSNYHGNIAYTKIQLGRYNGGIVTKTMPIFIYYKVTGYNPPDIDNAIIGINNEQSLTNLVTYNGVTNGSIINYMNFSEGLAKGYEIGNLGNNFAQTNTVQDMYNAPKAYIKFGITESMKTGYKFINLNCSDSYNCFTYVPAMVSVDGASPLSTYVMYDTGTPGMHVAVKNPNFAYNTTEKALHNNSVVSYSFNTKDNSQYGYTYTNNVSQPLLRTPVATTTDSTSIIGLEYFKTNSYIYNYTNNSVGFKKN